MKAGMILVVAGVLIALVSVLMGLLQWRSPGSDRLEVILAETQVVEAADGTLTVHWGDGVDEPPAADVEGTVMTAPVLFEKSRTAVIAPLKVDERVYAAGDIADNETKMREVKSAYAAASDRLPGNIGERFGELFSGTEHERSFFRWDGFIANIGVLVGVLLVIVGVVLARRGSAAGQSM